MPLEFNQNEGEYHGRDDDHSWNDDRANILGYITVRIFIALTEWYKELIEPFK